MRVETVALDDRLDPVQTNPIDGLIATCFDRAYLMFNLFEDDPRTCLDLCEGVFRSLDGQPVLTEQDFYGRMVAKVRDLPGKNEFLPGIAAESVLCWLLKDAVDFSYAAIAELMQMTREQVGESIAEVRMALVG
ncbi:MAG TPA: hypothetical protein VKB51_08830 [bacterium]|nr:hypothetical protein [bacterium]